MVKNKRLSLRIDEKTRENLGKLAYRFNCSLTELISMLANNKFIFVDTKVYNILQMGGYYLNSISNNKSNGTKGETAYIED